MNIKFRELGSNLVGRKFTNRNFASLTIDCLYLYFGKCAEIFATKKFASGVNSPKTRILLVAKISQFKVSPLTALL